VTTPLGVDIASVDGNEHIDWSLAKANGLRFIILRACYGTELDPSFHDYWKAAGTANVKRGAYLFLRFAGDASPEVQVDAFLDIIGIPSPTDLPPTIDLEFPGGRRPPGVSAKDALDFYLRAVEHFVRRCVFAPMTYTSYVVWVDPDGLANQKAPELTDTPLWVKYWPWPIHTIAHIDPMVVGALPTPPCPPPWGDSWAIEQYQGDAIKWPGFAATTDCDRFNQLGVGSSGGFVRWVQRRVKATVDGQFGSQTASLVKVFQQSKGLVADGVVGLDTFGYLAQV
jgi:GH25 family lysozyme M1 (1,4-beta-N-acetylmuramidase)